MAFTFAHPGAVININKKKKPYIDNIGLIIGSMAPDFEYFIHFKPYSTIGHNLLGLFILNLPLSILFYIFILSIKDQLIVHLPKFINIHLSSIYKKKGKIKGIKDLIIFSYSCIIGMLSHILWDSFTHRTGFFVVIVALLRKSIRSIPIYKILQHLSTIIGLIIMVAYIFKMEIGEIEEVTRKDKLKFFLSSSFIGLMTLALIIAIRQDYSIGGLVVSIINSSFIGLYIKIKALKRFY